MKSVLQHEDDGMAVPRSRDAKEALNETVCTSRCEGEADDQLKGSRCIFGDHEIRRLDLPDDIDEDSSTSDNLSSAQGDSFRKDPVVYTDKIVTDCDFSPERVIKDICMDEGVPVNGKQLCAKDVDGKVLCLIDKVEQDNRKLSTHDLLHHVLKESMKNDSDSHMSSQVESTKGGELKEKENSGDENSLVEYNSEAKLNIHFNMKLGDVSEMIIGKHSSDPLCQPHLSGEENNSTANMVAVAFSGESDSKDLIQRKEGKLDASAVNVNEVVEETVTLGDMLLMEKPESDPWGDIRCSQEEEVSKSLDKSKGLESPDMNSRVEALYGSIREPIQMNVELQTAAKKGEEEEDLTSHGLNFSAEERSDSNKYNATDSHYISTLQEPTGGHAIIGAVQNGTSMDNPVTTGLSTTGLSTTVSGDLTLPALFSEVPRFSVSENRDWKNGYMLEDPIEQISSHIRDSLGETSFSAPGPVSGLITSSGPIAYSGSLSIRSDSSTTSTRSFAFPVLQSEWNSSPVRMAQADRRQFRGHKRWGRSLLCCRF